MQGVDPHDRTIYIGTFNKSLFPGLRIGYGAGEYREIAALMLDALHSVRDGTLEADRYRIDTGVRELVACFPLPY